MKWGIETHMNKRAIHRLGKMLVLILRINHDHARLKHHRTQDLQFHKIAFPGAGLCKYHHVRVLELEPIEENETIVMAVDTVENAVIRREIGGNKRKRRRERCGVQVVRHIERVHADRTRRGESLLHAQHRRLDIHQLRFEHRLDRSTHSIELLDRLCVQRNVDAKAKKLLRSLLESVPQFFDIMKCRLKHRTPYFPRLRLYLNR